MGVKVISQKLCVNYKILTLKVRIATETEYILDNVDSKCEYTDTFL